ncbi:MAG: hypothetical protein Q9219_005851 [cf. Caloplaca sp. 3 TL-2023]
MSGITSPVKTCDINDRPLADGVTAQSGCNGGTSYMCSSQSPWAVNDNLAYGFAAVTASDPKCCTCYKLTFTSTSIKGKVMIVQATNTGNDVSGTQFDLAMPGGGFGQFDGCSKEWKATSSVWGAQYGGSNTNQCSAFPAPLRSGCSFRWDWMQGQSNPTVNYEQVTCPAELVAKSGCSVSGYNAPPSNPNPPTTTKKPTTTLSTRTTTKAQTPTTKASQPSSSSSSYPAGQDSSSSSSSSVVDSGSSLATGTATVGSVSESGAAGGPTGSETTGGAGGEEPTGTAAGTEEEEEEEEEDDSCEL